MSSLTTIGESIRAHKVKRAFLLFDTVSRHPRGTTAAQALFPALRAERQRSPLEAERRTMASVADRRTGTVDSNVPPVSRSRRRIMTHADHLIALPEISPQKPDARSDPILVVATRTRSRTRTGVFCIYSDRKRVNCASTGSLRIDSDRDYSIILAPTSSVAYPPPEN